MRYAQCMCWQYILFLVGQPCVAMDLNPLSVLLFVFYFNLILFKFNCFCLVLIWLTIHYWQNLCGQYAVWQCNAPRYNKSRHTAVDICVVCTAGQFPVFRLGRNLFQSVRFHSPTFGLSSFVHHYMLLQFSAQHLHQLRCSYWHVHKKKRTILQTEQNRNTTQPQWRILGKLGELSKTRNHLVRSTSSI